jgi:hypothetical protein
MFVVAKVAGIFVEIQLALKGCKYMHSSRRGT